MYSYKLTTATDESKLINLLDKYIVNHCLIFIFIILRPSNNWMTE